MGTGPYDHDTGLALAHGLHHVVEVWANHPTWTERREVVVESGSWGWDETRAPRARATFTGPVPAASVLDLLDPRTGVRVQVWAGYLRAGGRRDVHQVADLGLRDRRVNRPGNTLTLEAASDEALVLDNTAVSPFTPVQTSVGVAVRQVLTEYLPATPTYADATPAEPPDESVALAPGDNPWSVVDDLADRVGADIYDDGLRSWHFRPRATIAGDSALALHTGPGGNITGSDTALSREGFWHNAVQLTYEYENPPGTPVIVRGYAQATTGPAAVTTAGRKVYSETRTGKPITLAKANHAAAAVLRRLLANGRTRDLTALAAYWLRPGLTVTEQLPTGPQERHLVVAVEFDHPAGTMRLATRLPDNADITGE